MRGRFSDYTKYHESTRLQVEYTLIYSSYIVILLNKNSFFLSPMEVP